jgi:carboxymethylenebutenolidase
MGFCRGGRTVWEYAGHNKDVKAGVAFYGSLVDPPAQKSLWPKSPIELAPEMKAPVLGLYGEADQGIPVSQVDTLKGRCKRRERLSRSRFIPARRTASMPIIAPATARMRPRTPGPR